MLPSVPITMIAISHGCFTAPVVIWQGFLAVNANNYHYAADF
jgi:hypothetical protein